MMDELKNIIREMQKIRQEEGLPGLDDNTLFDSATRVFLAYLETDGKSRKNENPEQEAKLATEKQINLMKKWRMPIPANLTMHEAKSIIKEEIEKRKER